jgi:hypothetical protein
MAAVTPPFVLQGGSHPAATFRETLQGIYGAPFGTFAGGVSSTAAQGAHGVVYATDLAVTQNGTPNMSVNVAGGTCLIRGTENQNQGVYCGYNDATLNVVVAASDPTNPRRDLVVAKVRDSFYSGASADFSIVVVTGTPAASPVDPAVPADALVLARIAVAATSTTVVNANITDLRTRAYALGALGVGLSTNRPSGPYQGQPWYDSDLYALNQYTTATTSWRPPWNMPWGSVGVQSYSTATNSGVSSVFADVGPSVTFTAVANRIYKATLTVGLSNGAGTQLGVVAIASTGTSGGDYAGLGGTLYVTGLAAGSQTIKARAYSTDANPVSFQNASNTSFLIVEDIGPAANPA